MRGVAVTRFSLGDDASAQCCSRIRACQRSLLFYRRAESEDLEGFLPYPLFSTVSCCVVEAEPSQSWANIARRSPRPLLGFSSWGEHTEWGLWCTVAPLDVHTSQALGVGVPHSGAMLTFAPPGVQCWGLQAAR